MFARLSVDTDLVRAYGAASTGHAADLQAAASRLTTLDAGSAAMFGPVGARFMAALARAAGDTARSVTDVSGSLTAARTGALASAQAYEEADGAVDGRLLRTW
jgi:hypothetical protein